MAAVERNITHEAELVAGDVVTIRSGVIEIRDKVTRFYHEMWDEETGKIATTRKGIESVLDTEDRIWRRVHSLRN
jgi:acyl-CoA thioester hydrolase